MRERERERAHNGNESRREMELSQMTQGGKVIQLFSLQVFFFFLPFALRCHK